MDDRWESEISEYGAINITGFRIVDTNRRYVKDFLDGWKRLDPVTSVGAGKESISVSVICVLLIESTTWFDKMCKMANRFHYVFQAQAALMYDAVFVLVEAFNKLLRKKPDQFRSYTMRRMGQMPPAPVTNTTHPNANNANNAQTNRVLDCNTSKGWVNPWEHGDKISRYLRKVFTWHFTFAPYIVPPTPLLTQEWIMYGNY